MEEHNKVKSLAKLCGLVPHPDDVVTLHAVYAHAQQASSMETETTVKHGSKYFELNSFPTGCTPTGNAKVDDAIRILRLIHVYRHRHLQTKINEVLSNIQVITGDPKADLKIGRVGR